MGHYLICVCLFKHAASFQLCSVLSLLCICYLHQESYIWCVLGICYLLIFCFLYFSTFCCTFEPELLSKVLFIQSSIGAFPLHGTARYWFGTVHFWGVFHWDTVPGTWYFFSTTSAEVPSEPYRYQNVTCKLC